MTTETVVSFLDGGRVFLSLIVGLCFLRLGRATRDRLYYAFALAFFLLAISSSLLGLRIALGDFSVLVYVPRLLAFTAIIAAIVDKNRRGRMPLPRSATRVQRDPTTPQATI
jgi:hypothetical protein